MRKNTNKAAASTDAAAQITEPKSNMFKHIVTQEDLDANPGMSEQVKVGDEIEVPTLSGLTKEELIDCYTALEGELATAQEEIVSLNEAIGKKDTEMSIASINPTVKVGDDKYEVVHGLNIKGTIISKEDLAKNKKLHADLVATKSSALKKIN